MDHPNASAGGGERSGSSSTSKSLLGRAREGNASAWDQLSALYAPLVYHWCRLRGLGEADSADVVQDVFQSVAAHLGPFRKAQQGDTFRGWLRTITENKIRDHFRKNANEISAVGGTDAQHRLAQVPAPSSLGATASDIDWDGPFYRRIVELARQEFEERTWQAFWRTAIDDRPPADVGAELAMSAGAVRVAKCRVLKRLRELFAE
jgi:RNA polymerase sigma-70 factor (ECF subfamily)